MLWNWDNCKEYFKGKNYSNWIDFQLIQSGLNLDLKKFRSNLYQIQGNKPPKDLLDNDKGLTFTQYNLLWRPWAVIGNIPEKYDFMHFKTIYNTFSSSKWPRNKMKNLQKKFHFTENTVKQYLFELESRNIKLPTIMGTNNSFREHQTPYYDAIELQGYYYQIYKKSEENY